MAPRFDVGQQCYSSEKPYSGFDQQQPLTCDPNQVLSTPLQKINYTIHPNDQFVIQDQPSLQRTTNFQKGNLLFFQEKDSEEQITLACGTPGIDIENLLLSPQSIPQVQALQIIDHLIGNVFRLERFLLNNRMESPAILPHLLQVRRALQTGDPVFDKAVNREAIIDLARGLDPFMKAAKLSPSPVKAAAATDYGLTIRFENGEVFRARCGDPTTEELASWASRSFKEVLELGCLNAQEEGKIFLDRFRATIDVLKGYKTGEANTRQLIVVLEEIFKDCSARIEYLARNRPDILEQIAERCEAVLAASEEFSLGRLSAAEQGGGI